MLEMHHIATILFICAVLHTFCVSWLTTLANRFPPGSIAENLLHFLGEIEVVFGAWAAIFVLIWGLRYGSSAGAEYLQTIDFTEAAFVFVIMCMAATRPVLFFARHMIAGLAALLPLPKQSALYCTSLIVGPLMGSFITEPAAMTVTALLLRESFLGPEKSQTFRYASLGLLFVNISVGGTLTSFGAPPVIMVAQAWRWDTSFMLQNFGWRAVLIIIIGTALTALIFRKDLSRPPASAELVSKSKMPHWVVLVHLAFIAVTIINAHYIAFVLGLFLFFLAWCAVAGEYQDELRLKESLLVGFFLAGLVTLGKPQDWWLRPLLSDMSELSLYWGGLVLTSVTDNAALTYLGTLVPDLSPGARYALVAGAVSGGGLTVIANAPNPAGFGLLRESFGPDGISPLGLFLAALPFTLLSALVFLF